METHDTERIAGQQTGDQRSNALDTAVEPTSETPEDVAVLYSWANLQGAKYRDFSASRREYRAQMRHRAAELMREQELKAAAEAEAAAAAAEAEAAAAAAAAEVADNPNVEEAEYARQLALYEADQAARKAAAERLEAARRADAAAYAAAVAEHEAQEIAEAQASSVRQAARYADSEVRLRQSGMHARAAVPGRISDPYAPPELAAGGIFDQPGPPVSELEATRFRRMRDYRDFMDHGVEQNPYRISQQAESPRAFGYRPDEYAQDQRRRREDRREDRREMEPPPGRDQRQQHLHPIYEQGLPSTPYSEYKRATGGGETDLRLRPEQPISNSSEPRSEHGDSHPFASRREQLRSFSTQAQPEPPNYAPAQPGWDLTRVHSRSATQAHTAGALESDASHGWQQEESTHAGSLHTAPRVPPAQSDPYSPVPENSTASPQASSQAEHRGRREHELTSSAADAVVSSSFGRQEPAMVPRDREGPSLHAATSDNAGPAWLYPSPEEITRFRPSNYRATVGSDSGQKTTQPPAPTASGPGAAFNTLQHSREHVASRWYALRGVFNQNGHLSSADVGMRSVEENVTPMLAVFSLSGGVGKTSLVATLGRTLSSMGEKVLLSDTTSQGLLPYYFGGRELQAGTVRTFSPPSGSSDAPISLVSYEFDPKSLEPAQAPASGREGSHRADRPGPEEFLPHLVASGRGMHRVLIDLTNSSAPVARRIAGLRPSLLVPLAPDMNSVISLQALRRFIHTLRDADGQPIEPYFVLNQFDSALPLHLDVREVLSQQLGRQLLPFVIRRTPSVSEALAEGMTVVDYAPESPIAQDFRNLATWLRGIAAPSNAASRSPRWSER